MSVVLAYIEPVAGRLYPLVDTLTELIRRGHRVTVRTGPGPGRDPAPGRHPRGAAGRPRADLRAPGLAGPHPVRRPVKGLGQFGERARHQVADLQDAIRDERPDVLVLDETSWGAAAAAEASGLPWAFSLPSLVPIPSRDAPPFGLGLTPRHDVIGRVRDGLAAPLSTGALGDFYLAADLVWR